MRQCYMSKTQFQKIVQVSHREKKTATTITTNNKQILENNKSTRPADDRNARVVSKILLSNIQNRLNNIPLAFHKFVGTTTCIAFQWC